MLKRVCDKCGKEITTKDDYAKLCIEFFGGNPVRDRASDINADLCPNCTYELKKFLNYK